MTKTFGQIAYKAYLSKVDFADLADWEKIRPEVKDAWEAAADAAIDAYDDICFDRKAS